MTAPNLRSNANYLWGFADDIFPSTLLRLLNAVLEPTKQTILDFKATLDANGATNRDAVVWKVPVQALDSTSTLTLRDLGVCRSAGNNSWPNSWTPWAGSRRTCRISSTTRLARDEPTTGSKAADYSSRTAIRFAIGIPPTCDRCLL